MDQRRPPSWKWTVCGLLLLATMLNYMDRQTLSQLALTIRTEYRLTHQQYGNLEMGFGLAFAAGALAFGFLVDRIGARWLYPAVLIGWSCAGIATAYADAIGLTLLDWFPFLSKGDTDTRRQSDAAYVGFMTCRVVLGFFEAGHWPCALVTTQRILDRQNRSLGNSILQSGAAIGAIITPMIVLAMRRTQPGPDGASVVEPGGWRPPFVVIGLIGMVWVIPWLTLLRARDFQRGSDEAAPTVTTAADAPPTTFWRPFLVLVVVVIMINTTWQFFRAWLPMFLEEQHGYSPMEVGFFTSAYYIATDVGCLSAGAAVRWLAGRGATVHGARMSVFAVCVLLTLLAVPVALLKAGPLLLCLLLLLGAGALGLFPNHYSFTQELSKAHQGKIIGILGALAWIGTSPLQPLAGKIIAEDKVADPSSAYSYVIIVAGLLPLVALLALLLWRKPTAQSPHQRF